jgi:hypothetical protein
VPLLIGLFGPSGGGKTFSALRLATGIAQEASGSICMIDTEARRGLHYADRFKFQHLDFAAPFGSLAYLDAIKQCMQHKPAVIITDSMSHEHEGEGGMLDCHEAELQRLAGSDFSKRERVNALAWAKPKADRGRLLAGIMQANRDGVAALIFCFRAKEKMKLAKVGARTEFVGQGWMPIGDPALVYEMTMTALLLPRANGVPTWNSEQPGERMMMKLPEQFKTLFGGQPQPLSEETGKTMARWARGEQGAPAATVAPAETMAPAPAPPLADDVYASLTLQLEASAEMGVEALRKCWNEQLTPAEQAAMRDDLEQKHKPAARRADARANP